MATNKRTYPNNYFVYYNDDNRLAILCEDTSSSSSERTKEKYDSYQDADVTSGIRITYHSKYEEATATSNNLQSDLGLDSALHNAVACYVKARLYEDDEDFQFADYYRKMYEMKIKKFRSRRSAVRVLSVPKL